MASGTGTNDPPRIPPPNFDPESTDQFAKRHQPPLRGIMVDPDFPPTAAEASKAFQESRQLPPEVQSELANRPSNIRRSSGASQIFNQAPRSNEVINTIPAGDSLQPGKGRYSDTVPDATPREPPEATVSNALKSISLSDYRTFHQIPCVRPALLNGMVAGFALGGLMFVTGRTMWKSTNWAVWTFVGSSFASYEYCNVQRNREREGMKAAVKIVEEKKEEKRVAFEERKRRIEEARAAKKKAEEEAEAQRRRWYKFWEGRGREG
jgi:cytochrome c oxidase assembly protein subunit 20